MSAPPPNPAVQKIMAFFEEKTGQRLSEGRLWRMEIVLNAILRDHGVQSLDALHREITRNERGSLASATIHALTNHESSFFRDQGVFLALEHQVLHALNRTLPEKMLRIWSVGCSSGQEAYSMAMILRRQEEMWRGWRLSIVGTDISPIAIQQAQAGIYTQMDVQRGLAITDLLRWFDPHEEGWQVNQDLGSLVTFRADNILEPSAARGHFDIILCRNVMLYFEPAQRAKAFAALAGHARPESVLVLGAGETSIGSGADFMPSTVHRGLYQLAPKQDQGLRLRRTFG